MICPSCGENNSDNAALCTYCGYKFRFGHAFNDPANMTFLKSGSAGKSRAGRIVFFLFLLVMVVTVIVASFLKY
ncbi:zinc ribbon domain-containing protein [bacterium]|nr:zinc ribbon domain-containing protein [bacterium]